MNPIPATHWTDPGLARIARIESPAVLQALVVQKDEEIRELVRALQAMVIMSDRGERPRKLDEALTWLQNDELARQLVDKALAKHSKESGHG